MKPWGLGTYASSVGSCGVGETVILVNSVDHGSSSVGVARVDLHSHGYAGLPFPKHVGS